MNIIRRNTPVILRPVIRRVYLRLHTHKYYKLKHTERDLSYIKQCSRCGKQKSVHKYYGAYGSYPLALDLSNYMGGVTAKQAAQNMQQAFTIKKNMTPSDFKKLKREYQTGAIYNWTVE